MTTNRKPPIAIRGIILPSALFAMAGISGLSIRILTGEWMPWMDHSIDSFRSGLITIGLLIFGLSGVWVGVRLRAGKTRGLGLFGVVAALVGFLSLLNGFINGSGWYESVLCAFLVIEIVYIKAIDAQSVSSK